MAVDKTSITSRHAGNRRLITLLHRTRIYKRFIFLFHYLLLFYLIAFLRIQLLNWRLLFNIFSIILLLWLINLLDRLFSILCLNYAFRKLTRSWNWITFTFYQKIKILASCRIIIKITVQSNCPKKWMWIIIRNIWKCN